MRTLMSGVLAAALLTSPMASAQSCTRPVDKTAFDVVGLKSQLMVTAITCEATERYNAFILRYRPSLVAQEKVLNAYFSRNFGKRAQHEHDDYITSLANSQSQNGLKAGDAFCRQNVGVFDEVMALRSGGELPEFATVKNSNQPIELVACAGSERRARPVRSASAAGSGSRTR